MIACRHFPSQLSTKIFNITKLSSKFFSIGICAFHFVVIGKMLGVLVVCAVAALSTKKKVWSVTGAKCPKHESRGGVSNRVSPFLVSWVHLHFRIQTPRASVSGSMGRTFLWLPPSWQCSFQHDVYGRQPNLRTCMTLIEAYYFKLGQQLLVESMIVFESSFLPLSLRTKHQFCNVQRSTRKIISLSWFNIECLKKLSQKSQQRPRYTGPDQLTCSLCHHW